MNNDDPIRRRAPRFVVWLLAGLVLLGASTSVLADVDLGALKLRAQKMVDQCAASYARHYGEGSIEARFFVSQLLTSYEDYYGFRLQNPLGALSASEEREAARSIYQKQIDNMTSTYERYYGEGYLAKKKMEEQVGAYNSYIGARYGISFHNPLGQPTQADKAKFDAEQRPGLEKKYQNELDKLRKMADDRWGKDSEIAKQYVSSYKDYYERTYSIVLTNPYVGPSQVELTTLYQQQLDNLYQYLTGQGLSAEEIQEQVDALQQYYEGKYGVTLNNPSETGGESAQELQTGVEEETALNAFIKDSIRRLGGVITNERPVSTFVGDDYRVAAGFRRGLSIFDRRLMYNPPIGFPERRRPKRVAVVSKEVVR